MSKDLEFYKCIPGSVCECEHPCVILSTCLHAFGIPAFCIRADEHRSTTVPWRPCSPRVVNQLLYSANGIVTEYICIACGGECHIRVKGRLNGFICPKTNERVRVAVYATYRS